MSPQMAMVMAGLLTPAGIGVAIRELLRHRRWQALRRTAVKVHTASGDLAAFDGVAVLRQSLDAPPQRPRASQAADSAVPNMGTSSKSGTTVGPGT